MKSLFSGRKSQRQTSPTSQQNQPQDPLITLDQDLTDKVKHVTDFQGQVFWHADKNIIPSLDVRVERKGDDFQLHVPDLAKRDDRLRLIIERAPTAIGWMYYAGPEVTDVKFHLSDGQIPSLAQCSFSSFDPTKLLIPDFYFFRDRGYQELRDWLAQNATNNMPWNERSPEIIWRGRLTGAGLFTVDPHQQNNPLVRQRLRMAMQAKTSPLDFRFVSAVTPLEEHILRDAGFMADRMPSKSWAGRKFAIDIDGFSTTWDNLFHRFLMGNCVLKIDSQIGFRQWYYHRLQPYVHYVPIKKDLSDLQTQIEWVLRNDDNAHEIARTGQALAESLTWDAVTTETGQNLRNLVGLST